jgi:NitT/TauT family transport system substrate-binding protein
MKKTLVLALLLAAFALTPAAAQTPVLKVGHVGHDHHAALYVAAKAGEVFRQDYGIWLKEIRDKQLYELRDGEELVAEVELYKAGGGSQMPTMMSQGNFDVGLGGVAAVAFFVDKGSPMKIIAPLHSKGDMLVVKPGLEIDGWPGFVEWIRAQNGQVKIGYKSPVAVALLIFQRALQEAGISYTGDVADTKADILLVNMKEEANLNSGLQTGQIDGYVSNNPWCAIAEDKGIGKCVAELHDLPPGVFTDHPCCCIAANNAAMEKQGPQIQKFLELLAVATQFIALRPDEAVPYVAQWIGTTPGVEEVSMATSGYSMEPSKAFLDGMWVWYEEMARLDKITDKLKGVTREQFEEMTYDFSLLQPALDGALTRMPKK